MDAKPQRPLRALRTRNDENALPDVLLGKTIHQRNKSSPALSTTAASAATRGGTKRTAFGDVSNIVNIARPSKDDSLLPHKALQPALNNKIPALQERKSAAFLRPAQRPLSVSNLKSLLTGSTQLPSTNVVTKIPLNDSVNTSQQSNVRKTLTKRNTTIFKDNSLNTVQEIDDVIKPQPELPGLQQIKADNVDQTSSSAMLHSGLTSQSLLLPPPVASACLEPTKASDHFTSDVSLPGIGNVTLDVQTIHDHVQAESAVPEDVVNLNHPAIAQYNASITDDPTTLPATFTFLPTLTTVRKVEPLQTGELNGLGVVHPPASQPQLVPQGVVPESDDYWEEEEDEVYDDDGYVTARSFRSRGENTTGGATTVFFPHMNQKVRKEISAAKKLVEATRTAEEIEDESYDTSMVAEYGDEIFDYMRQMEVKMLPNAHYMDNQHEIQWSMRSVLMDWLVQVHLRFNLLPETLFLCVNYIDRFLSCKVVSLGKLQLVGATAIFIAAKYEEINCPSVQEIVYMVDGGYSVDEILKAERFMLTMLQFELGWPGPMSFLRRISKADDYDLETRTLAKYFLEITLMDERFIGSPPSFTAAASHCLARLMLRKGTWSPHHVYYSSYTFSQLRPLLGLLLECCDDPRKHHQAVYNKYCDKRYKRAAAFVETEVQRGFQLPDSALSMALTQPQAVITYYDTVSYFRQQ